MNISVPICGFTVVRLPHLNYDAQGRGAYASSPPFVGGVYYGGLRMPWFDLTEDVDRDGGRSEALTLWQHIQSENTDCSGIVLERKFEVAEKALRESNREAVRNEIVAIGSSELAAYKGSISTGCRIHWRGYDIILEGHFSLLENGLFVAPDIFERSRRRLNEHGLLRRSEHALELAREYQETASAGGVEPLPAARPVFIPFAVGMVVVDDPR